MRATAPRLARDEVEPQTTLQPEHGVQPVHAEPVVPDAPAAPQPAASSVPLALAHRRPMSVADIGAVMALEAQAYSHPWSHGNFVDSLAAGHLAEVLMEEGRLIGYFAAMLGVEELHLLNLTVAPTHQSRGLGSVLLAAVLAHARARALATVWLEVRASNARARALYVRRGFAEVGVRRGYYPARLGREDAVVMCWPVRPERPTEARAQTQTQTQTPAVPHGAAPAPGGADALD